jgi:ferrous iron transport protein A
MSKPITLSEAPSGKPLTVAEIHGGHGVRHRLMSLGIRPGVRITKLNGTFGNGPVVIQAGASQTALGGGISDKIFVEDPE